MQKFTHAHIFNETNVVLAEDGTEKLPVASTLPHRFIVVDGKIVEHDKYKGLTDNQVREKDHEDEEAKLKALQDAWDALEEKIGPRPPDLPLLTLPEE